MIKIHTEIVVVGSGAGGATIAKELSLRGRKVVVVEKGHLVKHGTACFHTKNDLCIKSKEGINIFRAVTPGGTTVISCANGIRSLEAELGALGIDLHAEFEEAEKELGIQLISGKFIGEGTRKIMRAASKLGFEMEPMPKFIKWDKCSSCGKCFWGCQRGAKWTALEYLNQASFNGARLLKNTDITKVLISKRKAVGVKGIGPKGEIIIFAEVVVLAAGAIGTPMILRRSGLTEAGNNLFADLQQVTYGITKNISLKKEPYMAAVNRNFLDSHGFILSPFADTPFDFFSSTLPVSRISKILSGKHILGVIVKIRDDNIGKVDKNGRIKKAMTKQDSVKMNKAVSISKKILIETGVIPESIVTSRPEGAHPGGTAAIGRVVNKNQETKISRLFVSDASVLPISPGLPPILTIIALSKRVAKILADMQL